MALFDFDKLEDAVQDNSMFFDLPVPCRAPVRCVIFDLFGTLVHMTQKKLPWTRFFARVAEECVSLGLGEFNQNTASTFCQTSNGLPCEVATQAVLEQIPDFGIDRLGELLLEVDFEADVCREASSVTLFDDSRETLMRLRSHGLRIGLVSNLATPYAGALHACGIYDLFDAVVFSFAEGVMKGQRHDHRIYSLAASKLNTSMGECLFVGDTVAADYDGPINSGMQAVHLNRRLKASTSTPRPTITTLAHLTVARQ